MLHGFFVSIGHLCNSTGYHASPKSCKFGNNSFAHIVLRYRLVSSSDLCTPVDPAMIYSTFQSVLELVFMALASLTGGYLLIFLPVTKLGLQS